MYGQTSRELGSTLGGWGGSPTMTRSSNGQSTLRFEDKKNRAFGTTDFGTTRNINKPFAPRPIPENTVVLDRPVFLGAPHGVGREGFGDKVGFNRDGSVLAAQGEWSEGGASRSALFVARRAPGTPASALQYNTPGGWEAIPKPRELAQVSPQPEFGTSFKLTADGRQLFTTVEDIHLTGVAPSVEVPVGYVYRHDGTRWVQFQDALKISMDIDSQGMADRARAQGYTTFQLDTSRALMSADGRTLAITTQLHVHRGDGGATATAAATSPATAYAAATASTFTTTARSATARIAAATATARTARAAATVPPVAQGAMIHQSPYYPRQNNEYKNTDYRIITDGTFGAEDVNDGDEDLPGRVFVFQQHPPNPDTGCYKCVQVIKSPIGMDPARAPNANFGKNSAMSGDGNWLAVTEDFVSGVFVFGRKQASHPFRLVFALEGLFPQRRSTAAETEAVALSSDGRYLVVAWKQEERKGEAGAFAVYSRQGVIGSQTPRSTYVEVMAVDTGVAGIDGMRIAMVGTTLRVALGMSGVEGQVWDVPVADIEAGKALPPTQPAFVVPSTIKGRNLNRGKTGSGTVFEAVALSGDGLTLALGAEAANDVLVLSLPPPAV